MTAAEYFMKERYEVNGFHNNKDASIDQNILSRFCNNFVGAISDQSVFPRIVVIVPDADLIKAFKYRKEDDVIIGYTRIIKWLMTQYDRMVATQKEYLPGKCKRADEPNFVWIMPPLHDLLRSKENRLRTLFGHALSSQATMHDNTYAFELKKIWDPSNRSYYNKEERSFTADGFIAYWQAVDKTVKYFETLVLKKKVEKKIDETRHKVPQQTNSKLRKPNYYDRFHWRKLSMHT